MSQSFTVEESALQIFNEGLSNGNKELKNEILFLFEQYGTDNFTIAETIQNIKRNHKNIKQNKILRTLQDMLNENLIKQDNKSKRIFIVNEENNSEETDNISDEEEQVLEYFNTTVSGAMTGVDFSDAIKDIKKQYGLSRQSIIKSISNLIKDGKLQKGPKDNTIMLKYSEEENFETIIPSIKTQNGISETQPLTNKETPQTLLAKGYHEVSDGIYVSADGKSQYILSAESKNNNFQLNKNMNYKNSYDYERLVEEFSQQIDDIESFDTDEDIDDMDIDNTDGLDELNDTDEVEEESYTVTLTKAELDLLKDIVAKFEDADLGEDELDDEISDDDDYIDDEATDEEATDDLVNGDEDDDLDVDIEEDIDDNEDFEEDFEDLVDDVDGGVYTGAGRNGATTLTKNKKELDRKGKPVNSKTYAPHSGTAYDGSGRNGAPSLTKHNASKERGGKPVNSKQTSGVGKSLFDL